MNNTYNTTHTEANGSIARLYTLHTFYLSSNRLFTTVCSIIWLPLITFMHLYTIYDFHRAVRLAWSDIDTQKKNQNAALCGQHSCPTHWKQAMVQINFYCAFEIWYLIGCLCFIHRFYLLAADRSWHGSCLRCSRCSQPLDTELSCFARDGNIYCKEDYYR